MRKQKGFSLIELLIVVAIILIIAAIAIPNLLRARMAANEASATSSIRTINTAEVTYQSTYPGVGYATLAQLGGPWNAACVPAQATACLIDSVLATNNNGNGKSGYNFADVLSGNGNSQYDATAIPLAVGQTGQRSFCAIEDAVVRQQATGAAPGAHDACMALIPLNQ